MKTRKLKTRLLPVLMGAAFASSVWGQGSASPEEIVEKVRSAAEMLSNQGEAGLQQLNKTSSNWVWKDTYVFALNCKEKVIAAHPVQPELIGRNLTKIKDKKGNEFLVYLCLASKVPGGGWVEYWWGRPGMGVDLSFRKISYTLQAGDTPYQVSAGVYDEKISVWTLNGGVQ